MFMDIDNSYVILNLICLIAFIAFWYFWNNRVDNLIMDVCFSCILCICWSFIYFYDAWIYPIVYLCCERMPLYSNCRLVNKFCDWVTRYKSFYYRYESPLRLSVGVFIPMLIISLILPSNNDTLKMFYSCTLCSTTYCFGMYNRYKLNAECLDRAIEHNEIFLSSYFLVPNTIIVVVGFVFTLLGINLRSESVNTTLKMLYFNVGTIFQCEISTFFMIMPLLLISCLGIMAFSALPFWALVFVGLKILSYHLKYGKEQGDEISLKSFWDKLF